MSKKWYLLQFKPNAHSKAIKNLNRQGFNTFLPMQNLTVRKGLTFKKVTRPLFPGYMFITFDEASSNWSKINNTYGVLRLVSSNSRLQAVPDTLINKLMQRCDFLGILLPENKFKKGDRVEVLDGPFANFIATIETIQADQRIWLLTNLMGRDVKIEINSKNLQPSN